MVWCKVFVTNTLGDTPRVHEEARAGRISFPDGEVNFLGRVERTPENGDVQPANRGIEVRDPGRAIQHAAPPSGG